MIVIIDGYNLLKQIFPKVINGFEKQRDFFVRQMGLYKSKKLNDIKEMIVVFDGGFVNHAAREVKHGIVVIFSGQKRKADDWIIDYVENNKGKEILVVTRDREIISKCEKFGADAISGFDFYDIVQSTLLAGIESNKIFETRDTELQKYETDAEFSQFYGPTKVDKQALDLLMEQASLQQMDKKDLLDKIEGKLEHRGKKLSKKEKKIYGKIKKL